MIQLDFRSFLKQEYASRNAANPAYSLRAFARDLKLSSGRLSDVMNGKSGLSYSTAIKIAKILHLSSEEEKLFVSYSNRRFSLTTGLRVSNAKYNVLPLDQFKVISDWNHFAFLEACLLSNCEKNFKWFSKHLGMSIDEVKLTHARLMRVGLLDSDFKPTEDFTATPTDIPSEAIRRHHQQILEKAKLALIKNSIHERDFSTMTVAVSSDDLSEAKLMIKKFRRKFNERFRKSSKKDRVYCLSIQYFPLTEKEEVKDNEKYN